jgi:SAM-dependent methyltransferase
VADLPPDFLADLQRLRPRPDLHESLWREPYLVEETYGHLYRIVRSYLDPPADVLDVGCGLGYVALELARDGCRVIGIDPDPTSVEVARRTRDADPTLADPSALSYEVADVTEWRAPPDSYDAIVAGRVLHHVPDLAGVTPEMGRWLRPGGRLVCVEFAYDRLDRRGASWVYQMRGLLRAAGLSTSGDGSADEPGAGIDEVLDDWRRHHEDEHHLNTYDQLVDALRGAAREERLDWLPYLYWEVLEQLDVPAVPGATVARFLRSIEEHLIATDDLPAVLFSWVGGRSTASG